MVLLVFPERFLTVVPAPDAVLEEVARRPDERLDESDRDAVTLFPA